MIPLAYVIRTSPQVPGIAPTLAPNEPHSTEHGSVEEELIAKASHTHALFRDDNSVVYYHLEKATRGTSYAASIKPFTRAKDGRGAWKALTSQYAGKDKWEAEIKRQEQLLHTRIWKGQSNFSLENFISQHRNAYVIQFPPEMDENWVRYGLAKLGQISRLPNWQRMLFCAYTTQLLHSTGEVCWNNKDRYFIWFEFVCRDSGQIASRRSWKRSCLGLEYTSKCSRLALLWEPN